MKHIIYSTLLAIASACLCACSSESDAPQPAGASSTPMTFRVSYPGGTRATETAFEEGDRIGLYVGVDTMQLEPGGNLVNNEALTLHYGTWAAAKPLYWSDGTYNAYTYYPFMSGITSVEEQPFSVSLDQNTPEQDGNLSGYEASDLLFASAKGLKASAEPINLQFRHIMSKLTIRLIKGEDYEGEMPTDAKVFVHNIVPEATIDLTGGTATKNPRGTAKSIRAKQESDYVFSAIIVPQRIDSRTQLVEVLMDGISYTFESRFTFKPGTEHLVNLVISDNPVKSTIEISSNLEGWN